MRSLPVRRSNVEVVKDFAERDSVSQVPLGMTVAKVVRQPFDLGVTDAVHHEPHRAVETLNLEPAAAIPHVSPAGDEVPRGSSWL